MGTGSGTQGGAKLCKASGQRVHGLLGRGMPVRHGLTRSYKAVGAWCQQIDELACYKLALSSTVMLVDLLSAQSKLAVPVGWR